MNRSRMLILFLFWFNFKILGSKQILKCVIDKTLKLFQMNADGMIALVQVAVSSRNDLS